VSSGGNRKREPAAVLITDAPKSRFDQLAERQRRYLISMGIRTVCLLLAIVVPYAPARVALVVGALVLPWLSVVGANGPLTRDARSRAVFRPVAAPALGPGRPAEADEPSD